MRSLLSRRSHDSSIISRQLHSLMVCSDALPDQEIVPVSSPDCSHYSALLRSCTRLKTLCEGHRVHDHIIRAGLEQNSYLHNLIIDMYGHCQGSLQSAVSIFNKMHCPDLFSLNFIIRAYTHNGMYESGLEVFHKVLCNGETLPDKYIYVSILSVCVSIKALAYGKKFHVLISSIGLDSEIIVSTALINMYAKCGTIGYAKKTFDKMPHRDVVSWNTMIGACALHGYWDDAIQLFYQINQEGEIPNKATLTTILDSCTSPLIGKSVHACIVGSSYGTDLILKAAISNMYTKLSSRESDASVKSSITPENTFLAQYVQQGVITEALEVLAQMQYKGIFPDKYTFVSMISACTNHGAFSEGEQMHAYISGSALEVDLVVGTALINMYGKCGKAHIARKLFDKMPVHDTISWTAMISAYTQDGEDDHALEMFKQMKQKGLKPNKVTFATIFDACSTRESFADGIAIHESILGSEVELDSYVGTALINMYGRFGHTKDAKLLFDKLNDCDVVMWNAMIAIHARNEEGLAALNIFNQMQEEGMLSNKVTFISTLDACAACSTLTEGKQKHSQVVAKKLDSDVVLATALIKVYGTCGCLEDAKQTFEEIQNKDIILWSTMMTAYAHNGQLKEAFRLFDELLLSGIIPDKVSCISLLSACVSKAGIEDGKHMHMCVALCKLDLDVSVSNGLITMYGKCGGIEEAVRIFDKMIERDNGTYVSILSACANQMDLYQGRIVHGYVTERGIELEISVGNALINMYSKCGSLQEASMVFNSMAERDMVSWTVMITSHAQHGHGDCALELFDQMQQTGISPNKVTLVNILNAFSHAGMVDEGFWCFRNMRNNNTLSLLEDHYNCIVDLLGRAGRLGEAESLIQEMPFPPSIITWTSLLNACRQQLDVERGEYAAERIFQIEPSDPAPYITMYNIYTAAGRVQEAINVISMLKEKRILKNKVFQEIK